jgi:hypothetical protein
MPYALCLMPYALCLMPYALCLMPYALCLNILKTKTIHFFQGTALQAYKAAAA